VGGNDGQEERIEEAYGLCYDTDYVPQDVGCGAVGQRADQGDGADAAALCVS